jgi:hypothetical protein
MSGPTPQTAELHIQSGGGQPALLDSDPSKSKALDGCRRASLLQLDARRFRGASSLPTGLGRPAQRLCLSCLTSSACRMRCAFPLDLLAGYSMAAY